MQFGEVRVDDAEGLILAHSTRLPTIMLKKGRVLTAADVAMLKASGINFVTGARLEAGDIGEDEAARMLAEAVAGEGVTVGPAFTGRCNLFAATRGVMVVDRERLDRLNLVDEAVTVATLHPFEVVSARQMLSTVKIIPFGVDRRVVDACAAYASSGGPLLSVRPFRRRKVGIIATTLPGTRDSVLDAALAVTRARVETLDGDVTQELRCPHDVGSLERTLGRALAAGCDEILVLGASATVDRRDVVPSAVLRAGGTIDHFGMPVDPGNLLLLAHVGAVPVVNLPGCARSPKPNGLDWVLRRLAAGIAITPRDMMRMGAGGMLKESVPRRERVVPGFIPERTPRVAAVIVADSEPEIVACAVESALAAGLEPIVVMVGPNADQIEEALPTCDVRVVAGGKAPVAAGIAALPDGIDAAIVMDARQDWVTAAHLGELVKAFDADEGRAVVVTVHRGGRGGPMLVGCDYFAALCEAAHPDDLLADHAEVVFEVVADDGP
ncbi:MAG TPA: 4-diphosphocytidyl-2C-methyl-D-erythritol kinase [Candidatus Omnitrophota bacterium]|nr:4-diphosphocytidyl-2C-methyl-D-erythritol kinase [Candidatus Omnitrophota bacterium]